MRRSVLKNLLRISEVVLLLTLGIVIVLFALPFYFSEPLGDDWCSASETQQMGVLKGLNRHLHLGNSGRYAGKLLEYSTPAILDFKRFYGFALGAYAIAEIIAIYLFCRTLLSRVRLAQYSIFLTLILISVFWTSMLSPAQSLYSVAYVIENQFSISAALLLFVFLLHAGISNHPRIFGLLSWLFAFIVVGIQELYGAMLCVLLWAGSSGLLHLDQKYHQFWRKAALGASLGFVILISMPGNYYRAAANIPQTHSIYAVLLGVKQMIAVPLSWIFDVKLLSSSLLVASFGSGHSSLIRNRRIVIRNLILLLVVVIASGFLIPTISLGKALSFRTTDALHLIFLLFWFSLLGMCCLQTTAKTGPEASFAISSSRLILNLVLVFALLLSQNTKAIWKDLKGAGIEYKNYMQNRYRVAEGMKNRPWPDRNLVISPPRQYPVSASRMSDVTESPYSWRNVCAARFLGVKTIQLDQKKSSKSPGFRNPKAPKPL